MTRNRSLAARHHLRPRNAPSHEYATGHAAGRAAIHHGRAAGYGNPTHVVLNQGGGQPDEVVIHFDSGSRVVVDHTGSITLHPAAATRR